MEVDTANVPEGDVKEEKMEVEEEQGAKGEKEKGESNPCQTGGQCVFCLSPTAESFSVCGECLAKTGNYQ